MSIDEMRAALGFAGGGRLLTPLADALGLWRPDEDGWAQSESGLWVRHGLAAMSFEDMQSRVSLQLLDDWWGAMDKPKVGLSSFAGAISDTVTAAAPLTVASFQQAIDDAYDAPFAKGGFVPFDLPPVSFVPYHYASFSIGFNAKAAPPPASWPTERSTRAEPITAWKRADIVCGEGTVTFSALSSDQRYAAVAEADCNGDPDPGHLVPDPTGGCRQCGFYAMDDKTALGYHLGGAVLLEVELYGRVIRHTSGYRAQHQRVLGGWVAPVCVECGRPATGVRFAEDSELSPGCASCWPLGLVGLADVSSLLGCELRWAE
ncbi:MAG: hypothetical protein V4472_24945 [Pseudomonadota bacterium]